MTTINTTHGPMDEALLERRDCVSDSETEHAEAVEYWLNGELVHRSVHLTLKDAGVVASILTGAI